MGNNVNTQPSLNLKFTGITCELDKKKGNLIKVVDGQEISNSNLMVGIKAYSNRIIKKDNNFIRAVVNNSKDGTKKLKCISKVREDLKENIIRLFENKDIETNR